MANKRIISRVLVSMAAVGGLVAGAVWFGGNAQTAVAQSQQPLVYKQVTRNFPAAPAMSLKPDVTYVAKFNTSKGPVVIELLAKDAPIAVNNFVFLARQGYYDGLTFHRYEPGFVVQGGCPLGTGTGGPGYTIKDEYGPLSKPHIQGAVGMARTGAPNSSGSQFYFCLEAAPHLNKKYTVFGQTLEGMDNVLKLRRGDKIESVVIEEVVPAGPATAPTTGPTTAPSTTAPTSGA